MCGPTIRKLVSGPNKVGEPAGVQGCAGSAGQRWALCIYKDFYLSALKTLVERTARKDHVYAAEV